MSQLFDAPVSEVPSWDQANAPEKPYWRVTVERTCEIDVFVRAYDRETANALAKDIQKHFVDDYRDARDFFDLFDTHAYVTARSRPDHGEPVWADGEWEDAS